ATATGDLRTARKLAERVRDLPFHREEGHLATARLIVVATLAGDWDEAVALAGQFREGWERAGRPRAGNLPRSAYAAATVPGRRGPGGRRVPLSVGPHARGHRRGRTGPGRSRAGRDGRDRHGLASRMRLNGVWVARRTLLKPASASKAASRRWPACAPSPRPTSWSSDPGVQITVDRP